MSVRPDSVLKILGYDVDLNGNIRRTRNQMAIITLEETDEGGTLRIHGDPSSFFYEAGETNEGILHPLRMSSKYVYFSDGTDDGFRIPRKEFTDGLMIAMSEYQRVISKESLRG